MSTDLFDEDGIDGFYLTRFYGGEGKGVCFQIGRPGGIYVQLTKVQMKQLVCAMIEKGFDV